MLRIPLVLCLASTALSFTGGSLHAAEDDGCSHFAWDISHEVSVLKQPPSAISAGTQSSASPPALSLDKPYEVKLAPQATVTYAVPPAKPTTNDRAQGGIVRFHTAAAGLYRISLTTGHWIDVLIGGQMLKSKDFSGSHSCAKPHKIVEFELPANRELVLQFSGGSEAIVLTSITAVAGPTAAD